MGLHFQESVKEEERSRATLCYCLTPNSHHFYSVSLAQCFVLIEDVHHNVKLEGNLLINCEVKAVSLFEGFYEPIVKSFNQALALVNTDGDRIC